MLSRTFRKVHQTYLLQMHRRGQAHREEKREKQATYDGEHREVKRQ